jgi:hypothetical protein
MAGYSFASPDLLRYSRIEQEGYVESNGFFQNRKSKNLVQCLLYVVATIL